jgi:hypothetical protein
MHAQACFVYPMQLAGTGDVSPGVLKRIFKTLVLAPGAGSCSTD